MRLEDESADHAANRDFIGATKFRDIHGFALRRELSTARRAVRPEVALRSAPANDVAAVARLALSENRSGHRQAACTHEPTCGSEDGGAHGGGDCSDDEGATFHRPASHFHCITIPAPSGSVSSSALGITTICTPLSQLLGGLICMVWSGETLARQWSTESGRATGVPSGCTATFSPGSYTIIRKITVPCTF